MTHRTLPRLSVQRPTAAAKATAATDGKPWFSVTAPTAAAPQKATIRIYGSIGDSYWDDRSTGPAKLAEELDELGAVSQIDLHVNSPGGDAFAGVAVYNMLADHDANVTVYVDGLAASAASVIAMAGDEIVMGIGAELMIHDASAMAWGPADEMEAAARMLNVLSDGMASLYAHRAGGTAEDWRAVMKAETWYSDKEAVSAGLADKVSRQKDEEAAEARGRFDVRMFHYKGRTEAPAPMTPAASATGQHDEGNPMNEAQMAALRKALGAPEDATPDALVALASETTMALAQAPLDSGLPTGTVAISQDVLAELKADATAGRQALQAQQKSHRESVVATAFRTGRITAAQKTSWLAKLEAEGPEAETVLMSLAEGLVPVVELGTDHGSVQDRTPSTPDAVRESAEYKGWTV